jgi:hypothetical protein
MLCRCGSGEYRYPLLDARGIFVAYVCDTCEEQVIHDGGFRPEIFEDPQYEVTEPIEPEEY